jgi:5-formyltetrahydrofolate cyclo-ligase
MHEIMIQQEKQQLRKGLREVIKKNQPSATDLESLLNHIRSIPAWSQARSLLLYAPLQHEPNLLSLLEEPSWRRFFFPRIEQEEYPFSAVDNREVPPSSERPRGSEEGQRPEEELAGEANGYQQELQLYEWFPNAPWIKGPHGILEPDPQQWQRASLAKVDLALIPGLAFDRWCHRLGWGHGYFDRLLQKPECSALKVGIAWSWQIVQKIPREAHDVSMDLVVTPENYFQRSEIIS